MHIWLAPLTSDAKPGAQSTVSTRDSQAPGMLLEGGAILRAASYCSTLGYTEHIEGTSPTAGHCQSHTLPTAPPSLAYVQNL